MTRRYARRNDPVVPKVQRVELTEGNLALRLLGVGVAIAVAVAAFGYLINSWLTGDTGWQEISVSRSETGISTQFILQYNVGASDMGITAEKKAVSMAYGDRADEAYRVLSNQSFEHYQNIAYLNAHPNETVQVDELLYDALEQIEAADCRYIYLAPLFGMYNSLFGSLSDNDAMKFDPVYDAESEVYVREIAAFAQDPQAVQLQLLGNQQVKLCVSDPYLQYAKENEVDSFVDLGLLQNAFILDAIAQELIDRGLTNGVISSYDGYTRTLSAAGYDLNVYDLVNGSVKQCAVVSYAEPMSAVTMRSFPMLKKEEMSYYTYGDGTVRGPYIAEDGMLRAAAGFFGVFSRDDSCAALLMRALPAYTSEQFEPDSLSGISWVISNNGVVQYGGSQIAVKAY